VGLGDPTGLYHGTQPVNQGQMDRWNIVAKLDYLPFDAELRILQARVPALGADKAKAMVQVAELTRAGFAAGDLSTVMSPRTVISWAQNTLLFGSAAYAFRLSFANKCDETERAILGEYFQRCFGEEMEGGNARLTLNP